MRAACTAIFPIIKEQVFPTKWKITKTVSPERTGEFISFLLMCMHNCVSIIFGDMENGSLRILRKLENYKIHAAWSDKTNQCMFLFSMTIVGRVENKKEKFLFVLLENL